MLVLLAPRERKRDLGFFVDAVSLDIFVGGNKYSRKFISEYFNATGTAWIVGGLQGEEPQSKEAFQQARDQMMLAVANQPTTYTDTTVTTGPAEYGGQSILLLFLTPTLLHVLTFSLLSQTWLISFFNLSMMAT